MEVGIPPNDNKRWPMRVVYEIQKHSLVVLILKNVDVVDDDEITRVKFLECFLEGSPFMAEVIAREICRFLIKRLRKELGRLRFAKASRTAQIERFSVVESSSTRGEKASRSIKFFVCIESPLEL